MQRLLPALAIAALTAAAPSAQAITTFLTDPNDPLYIANDPFYSGVARLNITKPGVGTFGCTGSLLTGGLAVLTAAHCVAQGDSLIAGTSVTANFGGFGSFVSTNIVMFPTYSSATNVGDLALVFLGGPVVGAQTYDIYRDTNEAGQIGDIAGFGRFGNGNQGSVNSGNGVLRHGTNLIDYTASSTLFPANGSSAVFLAFDFDNGTAAQNSLAIINAAYNNLGTGNTEVGTAPGDSGGPTFLGNRIAGVTSFGTCFGTTACSTPPDIDTALNSTFGELFFNTRVSSYTSWIDQELAEIPEPNTVFLLAAGLALIAGTRAKRY